MTIYLTYSLTQDCSVIAKASAWGLLVSEALVGAEYAGPCEDAQMQCMQ